MYKKPLKLANLNISIRLNIWQLIEEHNEALNTTKDNERKKFNEELDKLRQISEDKKGDAMEIGEEQDML